MSFDPVAALARYHAMLDARDLDGVERLLAPNVVSVSEGLGHVKGREAVIAALRAYFAACPDDQSFEDDLVALGPLQARSLWKLRATHKLTGVVVERRGTETVSFDADGLIMSIEVEDAT